MRGSGQPVQIAVTREGAFVEIRDASAADLTVRFLYSEARYQRGNANDDGHLDISDPIYLLSRLFYRVSDSHCPAAFEANGDGRVDISDGVFLFNYLFLGGPQPPGRFPDCEQAHRSSDASGLSCSEDQITCESSGSRRESPP